MYKNVKSSSLQKSLSQTKTQKPKLISSLSNSNYVQINPRHTSLQKAKSNTKNLFPSKKASNTSPSTSKHINSKKLATSEDMQKSFSINQSLNCSKVNVNLSTSNAAANNIIKRKKILNVNLDDYSLENDTFVHHRQNHSTIKATMLKREEPFKLYTISHNKNDSMFINDSNSLIKANKKVTLDIGNEIDDLERKLLKKLAENKRNSKSKKYNAIKGIFEEMINLFPEDNQKLLLKLITGYHEVVTSFANENKHLKEVNSIQQKKIFSIEKENINLKKELAEKESEIARMRKKTKDKPDLLSKSTNETIMVSSNDKEIYSEKEKVMNRSSYIEKLNKSNFQDLDALYFNDKVKMKSETGHSIPILDFQFNKKEKNGMYKTVNVKK